MKQKIVLKVAYTKCKTVGCDKCKRKALKIATKAHGVTSVSLQGADKDQLEVIGDEVDSVCLANSLRKKSYHAEIIKVEEVKDKDKDKDKDKEKEPLPWCLAPYPPCPPSVVYDPYVSNCIIM